MNEVIKKLEAILKKIEDNKLDAWEDNLEELKTVAILEDFDKGELDGEPEIKPYNGWFDDLQNLINELKTQTA